MDPALIAFCLPIILYSLIIIAVTDSHNVKYISFVTS